jgi:hypothetical protein
VVDHHSYDVYHRDSDSPSVVRPIKKSSNRFFGPRAVVANENEPSELLPMMDLGLRNVFESKRLLRHWTKWLRQMGPIFNYRKSITMWSTNVILTIQRQCQVTHHGIDCFYVRDSEAPTQIYWLADADLAVPPYTTHHHDHNHDQDVGTDEENDVVYIDSHHEQHPSSDAEEDDDVVYIDSVEHRPSSVYANATKDAINLTVVNWISDCAKASQTQNPCVVLLDTAILRSTHMMLTALPTATIIVPNMSKTFPSSSTDLPTVLLHPQTYVLQLLRDSNTVHMHNTHFWLDYCCTWVGNQWCRPQVDIALLILRQALPKVNGVLALTFCLRGVKKTLEKTPAEVIRDECTLHLQRVSQLGGRIPCLYEFDLVHCQAYNTVIMPGLIKSRQGRSSMLVLVYRTV